MKKILLLIVLGGILLVVACKEKTTEEAVAEAVQESYEHLLAGHYEDFLSGRADGDSLPEAYREQLLVSYKQFMAQQQNIHGGLRSFTVRGVSADTLQHLMQAFLVLNYADSTREEIVVPMVERNGEWKMK